MTVQIKPEFVEGFERTFKTDIDDFDMENTIISVNGKKSFTLSELVSPTITDILDMNVMNKINAYNYVGCMLPVKNGQKVLPFEVQEGPDSLKEDIDTMGNLIKSHFVSVNGFKKGDNGIIKIDDKYVAVQVRNINSRGNRIVLKLKNPEYKDVTMMCKSDRIISGEQYMHEIGDVYNDILDDIEEEYEDMYEEIPFSLYERQVAIDSVFTGIPFLSFAKKMKAYLFSLKGESDSKLSLKARDNITDMMDMLDNQLLRNETVYDTLIKNKREINKT